MKLREFYDLCIKLGAEGDFVVAIDGHDFVALDEDSTGIKDGGVFDVRPVFNNGDVSKNSYTLDKLYIDCKMMGCKDKSEIKISNYNISKPKVDFDYNVIFID